MIWKVLFLKFWWGQQGDRRKIHWVKWKTLIQSKSKGGMGFKDLAHFNDALLAKQAWRLLHNKDLLLHKVFKSKFFLACSFMEALDNSSGSYAWSCLLKGKEVLWRGARWRVGNGESIKIWDYPWLPSLEHPWILSLVIEGHNEATVDYLINPISRSWDRDIVVGFFAPLEVELIMKIPLSSTNVEDKLIWPHVSNGVYTVKSGYRFLVQEKAGPWPSPQAQDETSNIWRQIWGLLVPNKVKNFLWTTCKEALPVKKNLVHWKVITEDVCCHCKLKDEDGYHALWDCPELLAIWEANMMWLFYRSKKFPISLSLHASCWEWKATRIVRENCMEPNQLWTSNKSYLLSQVISSAKQMLQEFSQVQPVAQVQVSPPQRSRPKWEPPPPSLLKINSMGQRSITQRRPG